MLLVSIHANYFIFNLNLMKKRIKWRLIKICWQICSPIHLRLLGQSKFKPCLCPGYFLLQLSDCMMETYILLDGSRVHEHC